MKRLKLSTQERSRLLGACPLFESLAPNALGVLAKGCHVRQYEKGETIFVQGEEASGIHVVAEGLARIFRTGVDGREQVLHLHGAGEPCGEVAVFEGGVFPASMVANDPLKTLFLPREHFLKTAEAEPQVLMQMLAMLSRRLRRFVRLIDDISLKEVSARLARYLLELAEETDDDAVVTLDSTKAILASRLGTIAETLSRTLKKMQTRGMLSVQGRTIHILNRSDLEELASGARL